MSSILWQSLKGIDHPLLNLRQAISGRIERWAQKRQGQDRGVITLHSGRTYILPTSVGLVFALMTFAMLLGSMNYNNNMSFALTFILAGLGLVAMHQCQRNLVGLEIKFAGADPVFAGQAAVFRISLRNQSRKRRYQLQVYSGAQESLICDLAAGESKILSLSMPTQHRGLIHLPRFGVRSKFPFELFNSWAWLYVDLLALVYPHPATGAPRPPATIAAQGHRQHDARGEEDFAGLRTFRDGDSPHHVAWKAYARTGELLSKQFSGADTSSQWFDLASLTSNDLEVNLSILTRWILDANQLRMDYGLRLPGTEFPPSHGESHRHRCLAALALYGEKKVAAT